MKEHELLLYNTLSHLHSLQRAPGLQIVRDLLGLQAQFSRNPEISLRLRANDYAPETWSSGLVKVWTHRGTIHVVAEDELGLYLSAADPGEFRDGAWDMTAEEQRRWAPFIVGQIRDGNDTRDGLKQACADAGMSGLLLERAFHGWGGLIKEMANRGLLACATGTDKRYALPQSVVWTSRDDARRTLIYRYFETFGPATPADCRGFFGWPAAELKPLLDGLLPSLSETTIGRRKYYHVRPLVQDGALPDCVLLPGFDQLVLGYRDRSRFLAPEHSRKVVNMAGIVFPVILLRGMLRARWKLEDRRVLVTPFERLLKKDEAAIRRTVKRELGLKEVTFLSET